MKTSCFSVPENRLQNFCHSGSVNGQLAAKTGLLVQSVQLTSERTPFVGVCAAERPSPQLMNTWLSEERLVYSFSKVDFETVKGI